MSLQGKVVSVTDKGNKAKVLVKPVADCNGCKACAGLLKANKDKLSEQEIEVLTNNFKVEKDDLVSLELTEYQGSKAAIILYGIPIIGFIAGMLVIPYICNLLSIEVNDGLRAIGAFIGLFISMFAIAFYLRSKKTETFMMRISSIKK